MLSINKIRAAIRLKFVQPDMPVRLQARIVGASHTSVIRLSRRCKKHCVDHLLAEQLNDSQLVESLYQLPERVSQRREPDFNEEFTELSKPKKKRKTRTVMFLKYRALDPSTALSKSQYFRLVNKVVKRVKVVMRQHHCAGETVYIDYAGTRVFYTDKGKKIWVKVFVAVLGASKKLFAWATYGEKTQHWVDGMARMFDYYGGVTEVVSMDNAKALVTETGLVANLTKNIEAFGQHYGCIMDTCRPGRPQDKSLAELGVKFVTQRILVPMLEMDFFNLSEINRHITVGVEILNNENFQGFNVSRNDLFWGNEFEVLGALPKYHYEMFIAQEIKNVGPNYHVRFRQHEYSVPYQYATKRVEVIATQSYLRILFQKKKIAEHLLSERPMEATTLIEHMPPEHLADYNANKQETNLEWAKTVGEPVYELVNHWYSNVTHTHSRPVAKKCQALMKIARNKEKDIVSDACRYAMQNQMESPSDISLIISAQSKVEGVDNLPSVNVPHANVRGANYFGGHHEA